MKPDEKTPRDWLLTRRASAVPQLDLLRRRALPPRPTALRDILSEIFRPHRAAWRILAATWVALILFQLALGRQASPHRGSPPPSPEVVAAWFAQFKTNDSFAQIDRLR